MYLNFREFLKEFQRYSEEFKIIYFNLGMEARNGFKKKKFFQNIEIPKEEEINSDH